MAVDLDDLNDDDLDDYFLAGLQFTSAATRHMQCLRGERPGEDPADLAFESRLALAHLRAVVERIGLDPL